MPKHTPPEEQFDRTKATYNGTYPHPAGAIRGNNFKYKGYHMMITGASEDGTRWRDVNTGKRYFISYEKIASITNECEWSSVWPTIKKKIEPKNKD